MAYHVGRRKQYIVYLLNFSWNLYRFFLLPFHVTYIEKQMKQHDDPHQASNKRSIVRKQRKNKATNHGKPYYHSVASRLPCSNDQTSTFVYLHKRPVGRQWWHSRRARGWIRKKKQQLRRPRSTRPPWGAPSS
jgi:hypothetical protein